MFWSIPLVSQVQQSADADAVTQLMSEQSAALQQRVISLERERDVAESTAQARAPRAA